MLKKQAVIVSIVLVSCFLFTLFSAAIALKADDPQAEIERIKEEQKEIEAEKERLKEEMAYFEDEEELAGTKYGWLLERSKEERERFQERVRQLMKVYSAMDSVKKSYEIAMERFEEKKEQYGQRISAMFAMQNKSYLEIFLESDTIEGFFTTLRLMRAITAADEEALADLKRTGDQLLIQKKQAEDNFAEMQAIVDALQKDLESIEGNVREMENEVWRLQQALIQRADSLSAYNALDEELQQALQEYELQARGMQHQNLGISWTGGIFAHPCPGYTGITSGFGPRNIPSLGINDFHTGLDMAAASGTPVIAAAPGYVFHARFRPIGGNVVSIDHGDGLTTNYCHLSGFNCYEGQMVQAGDVIGYVGATGMAYGPHLHFEVQVGGTPVNPVNYLN